MNKKGKLIVLHILLLLIISLFSACMSNNVKAKESHIEKKDTVIYLTRHGETLLNVLVRFQGWSDSPLTEKGEALTRDLGNGLNKKGIIFDRVYSSDSGRSLKTAEIILREIGQENLKIHSLKEIREWYFGSFEGSGYEIISVINQATGLTGREILTKTTWIEYANAIAKGDPKGLAENWEAASARIMKGLDIIAKESESTGGGNILVVSHGNAISTIIENLAPELLPPGDKNVVKSCSITKIIYKNGVYTVDTFNDLSYLDK